MFLIKKEKALKIGEICFKTHFSTFGPDVFFHLKFMNFGNVFITKVISSLCGSKHGCII